MNKNKNILKWGLGISWLTSWFLIVPISVIAIVVTIYKLVIQKSELVKYAILFSPFVVLPIVNMGMGIFDYANGKAKIKIVGYPAEEFANIDNEYRVENESLGCSVTGIEYLTAYRYNQVVRFLIKHLGFQKSSYIGLMPSKEEAKVLLLSDKYEIGITELTKDDKINIIHNSQTYQIDLNKQHGLVQRTINESELFSKSRMVIVEDCLVSQLNDDWIYLVELKGNRVIAQYRN